MSKKKTPASPKVKLPAAQARPAAVPATPAKPAKPVKAPKPATPAKPALPAKAAGFTAPTVGADGKLEHPLLVQARELARKGDPKGAADAMEQLARQTPPFERAQLLSLASQYVRLQDLPRAIALAAAATEADPSLAQAWMALSIACDEKHDRAESLSAAQRAMQAKASPAQLVDIGRHLSRLGDDRNALDAVTRGYQASGEAIELASFTLRVALQSADWALADRITTALRAAHAAGRTRQVGETPRTHLLWCADEATNIKVIGAFAERSFPAMPPMAKDVWPGTGTRKLRIGYLSSDYRDHATTLLALGMMRHHDRERFEFYGYCTSYDDGSAIRRDMLSRFDVARSFSHANDRLAAQQIHNDKIDVLVDLNGLTEGTRHGVLAWRPAPVQICYLGFPGTVGGRFVDYIVGDDYTVPEGAEALYPEQVIRIPPTYQINDYHARYLPPPPRRKVLGLPDNAPVIGMFNNVNKVGTQVWETWMQILRAVPAAVLWLMNPGEVAREFLQQATTRAGVDPKRLLFAPKVGQEAHLARLRQCDLILDPWPYGGHTTTSDAIFAEVPQVTLEGTNFASRVSGGLLRAAGLGTMIRPDIASYVQLAVGLLNKPAEVAKLKQLMRERKPRMQVFNAPLRTRQLERAYLEAHARAVKGVPHSHFAVSQRPRKPAPAQAEGGMEGAA